MSSLADQESVSGVNNTAGAGDLNDVSTESDCDTVQYVERKSGPHFALKMLNISKEIAVMLIVCVVYAALTTERPPKLSKPPAAYPFFSENSSIVDWYNGQVSEAIEAARRGDLAFVMFYAPWDADSQAVRNEFEKAADYMENEVTFAAVNCWQPGSECKRQYNKVYRWPVLIAYPTHGRGIQYNGPLEAFHMINFLKAITRPVVRVENVQELLGKFEIAIVANLNTLPGSYEYAVFYASAMRYLEKDYFKETVFGVVPQAADQVHKITLYGWNRTWIYKGELLAESLLNWIKKHSQQVVTWMTPTAMKSLNLGGFLQSGPTLILFTPRNPIQRENDYFNLLREIAYEYNSCANCTYIKKRKLLVTKERLISRNHFLKLKIKCEEPSYTITNLYINNSQKGCECQDSKQVDLNKESPYCRDYKLLESYTPILFQTVMNDINVTDLSYQTNSTLKFIVIDSLRFYHLAERLGIDLSNFHDNSAAVIINEKMETHHILVANITPTNLREFVLNFTKQNLNRAVVSKINSTRTQPSYPFVNLDKKTNSLALLELTSDTFLPTILNSKKVVLLFYYSKQCAVCSGISYMFLTIAKMLATLDDIEFARIDGDTNLLPWEFTMGSYPTILLIPSISKSESRAFPQSLSITVPNLIGFLLTNTEPTMKLKIIWTICSQTKFLDDQLKCMTSLRLETLSVIEKTLKMWRTSKHKHKVLHKLQKLKHLHLLFAHFTHDVVTINTSLKNLRD